MIEYDGDDMYFKNYILIPLNEELSKLKTYDADHSKTLETAERMSMQLVAYASKSLSEWYDNNRHQVGRVFLDIKRYKGELSSTPNSQSLTEADSNKLETSSSSSSNPVTPSAEDAKKEAKSKRWIFSSFSWLSQPNSNASLNQARKDESKDEPKDESKEELDKESRLCSERNSVLTLKRSHLLAVNHLLRQETDFLNGSEPLLVDELKILDKLHFVSLISQDQELTLEAPRL